MIFPRNGIGSMSTTEAFLTRSTRSFDPIWYRGVDSYNQDANEI